MNRTHFRHHQTDVLSPLLGVHGTQSSGSPPQPSPCEPPPASEPIDGRITCWLTDPADAQRELWRDLLAASARLWDDVVQALPFVATSTVTAGLLIWLLRTRAWRRARANARWLTITPPPMADTANGQQLWRALTGLLRPGALGSRMRLLAWELHSDGEQVVAGLWVPGTVNAQHVAHAVASAYHRAATEESQPGELRGPSLASPTPTHPRLVRKLREWWAERHGRPLPQRRPVAVAYVVVPRTSMWQPLLTDTPTGSGRLTRGTSGRSSNGGAHDPLAALCLALAGTPAGYQTVVQVMTRPLAARTRGAARRIRRTAGDPPGPGMLARGSLGLITALMKVLTSVARDALDLAAPGPTPRPSRTPAARPGAAKRSGTDPVTQHEHRAAAEKASAELVEICVRVAAFGQDRRRCRELAWQSANTLRTIITAQATDSVRLRRAERTVSLRGVRNRSAAGWLGARAGHSRGWFVATDTEVGAIARLPHRPATYGFSVAGAPHVPVPKGIPRLSAADLDSDGDAAGDGEAA